jgi:GNAT superfamily N-acetyltransferase
VTGVRRVAGAEAFLAAAGPLLMADEIRHNLLLGLAHLLARRPDAYDDASMWIAAEGGETVGAALMTPPFNPVVARPRVPGALAALAGAMHAEGLRPPGVTAALPEAEGFAAAWSVRARGRALLHQAQRVYALHAVAAADPAPGRFREPRPDELPLLVGWARAFAAEAGMGGAEHADRMVEERLARPLGLVLWDDDGPVAMAGSAGETPGGVRVGPVYTPPARRGCGYASALVAELSRRLLAGGRRWCALYTDLANPTSNRIYQRIGYRPVCDSAMYDFATV